MSRFIEVNQTGEKCVINLDMIKRVIPVINGVGCVVHFEQGTLNVSEPYESFKERLLGKEEPKVLNEEVTPKKKESSKNNEQNKN